MTHQIKTIASVLTLVVMSALTAQVNADEYHHIDRLAVKIQQASKRLVRETVHYRHTPEYRHMVADANAMYRLASHIHDVTHFEGNLAHLQHDLDDLDRQFHHIEGVFDRVEHNAAYGEGHVHGRTKHVKRLLNTIEDAIHHMTEDVQAIRSREIVVRPVYQPPVYQRPVYQRPVCTQPVRRPVYDGGHGHGGGGYGQGRPVHGNSGHGLGFSIGGGSSRITFRF